MRLKRPVLAPVALLFALAASACSGSGGSTDGSIVDNGGDEPAVVESDSDDEPAVENSGTNALTEPQALDLARQAAANDGASLDGLEPRVILNQGFWEIYFESTSESRGVSVYIAPDGNVAAIEQFG